MTSLIESLENALFWVSFGGKRKTMLSMWLFIVSSLSILKTEYHFGIRKRTMERTGWRRKAVKPRMGATHRWPEDHQWLMNKLRNNPSGHFMFLSPLPVCFTLLHEYIGQMSVFLYSLIHCSLNDGDFGGLPYKPLTAVVICHDNRFSRLRVYIWIINLENLHGNGVWKILFNEGICFWQYSTSLQKNGTKRERLMA